MSVNLDVPYNPHPKVLEEYKKYNNVDRWDKASDQGERKIFDTATSSTKPIIHKITQIYRQLIGQKEYCYFHEHLETQDVFGNFIDHTRIVGRYDLPIFVKRFNVSANKFDSTEIKEHSQIHEFEWSTIKPQIEEWISTGVINENTKFIAWAYGRKYSNANMDQFLNLSMQELVTLGRFGTLRPETVAAVQEAKKASGRTK